MARKGESPALYELIGRRRKAERPAEAPPSEPAAPPGPGWFSPGRRVRVPIGYIWLAAAALVLLLAGSFSLGYLRGERDAQAEAAQDLLAAGSVVVPPPEGPAERPRPQPPAAATAPAPDGDADGGWGPLFSDPRVAGRNYFVLIHTRRDAAERLALFCREHGVEAYVVPADNTALSKVIALPGYEKGERASPRVQALQARIEEVRRKWKLQVNPRDDLAYYPERFDG